MWEIKTTGIMLEKIKKCIEYFNDKYEWLMSLMLKAHHVHVNREKYIRKLIKKYCKKLTAEEREEMVRKAMDGSPMDVLNEKQAKNAYNAIRWHYASIVFFVSFFTTTVPDNIWIVIIACAIDLYVFQCVVFRAMQRIMMLYGQPLDLDADANTGIDTILSVNRSGVMIGKYPIVQKLKSGLGFLAKQAVKKLGPKVVSRLSRPAFLVIRRQFIKWFSVIVLKEHVSIVFDLLIPITCAAISGIVSVIILIPMCNNLRKNIITKAKAEAQG